VSGLEVLDFTDGASHTLSGNITQAAGKAQLSFAGNFLGLVGKNASFNLTGNAGSASFSVTSFESLSAVATRINAQTATTGVTARVQGTQLIFESSGVGSSALVQVQRAVGHGKLQ
jgi:hypothetical protein